MGTIIDATSGTAIVLDLGPNVLDGARASTLATAQAGGYAASAQAAAAAVSTLPPGTFLGAVPTALPYELTGITLTAAGSGGTPSGGPYALGFTGGPQGAAGTYSLTAAGAVDPASISITNRGLSTSNVAPALTFPYGGVGGATATAAVGTIAVGRIFYAVSSDGLRLLAWGNNAGVLATAPFGGTQLSLRLTSSLANFTLLTSSVWGLAFATSAARQVLAGIKQTGEFFASKLLAGVATITTLTATTATIITGSMTSLTATNATVAGVTTAPVTSKVWAWATRDLGGKVIYGVKLTGAFFAQTAQFTNAAITNLTATAATFASATLAGVTGASKSSALNAGLVLAADGHTVLSRIGIDGYAYDRRPLVRRQTAHASSNWVAWTIQNGSNWEIRAQNLLTGSTRLVHSSTAYHEIIGVETVISVSTMQAANIIVRDAVGNIKAIGADDSFWRGLLTTDGFNCWGDSITGGAYGYNYPATLATLIAARAGRSVPVLNSGIGGQTAAEIAARAGAVPMTITAAVTIPARTTTNGVANNGATGAGEQVAVTIDQTPLTTQGSPIGQFWLGSTPVILYYNITTGALQISRMWAGAAIAVAAGAQLTQKFDLDNPNGDQWRRIQIIGIGNNPSWKYRLSDGSTVDPTHYADEVAAVIADTAAMVRRCEAVGARYIIRTSVRPCLGTDTTPTLINNQIRALWPNNTDDIRALLMAHGNGSALDNADIAAGNVPSSQRAVIPVGNTGAGGIDGIHLSQAAHDLCAQMHVNTCIAKGWY